MFLSRLFAISLLILTANLHAQTTGVVRFRNSYEHMYASSSIEMDALRANGYVTESRVFELNTANIPGTTPMYRTNLRGYHVYTNNLGLVNLIRSWGGAQETALGYIYTSQIPGTVALYSYANATTQSRFLTTNVHEIPQGFVADPFGKIAGYVRSPPKYKVGAYYLGMWSPKAYDPPDLTYPNSTFYINQGNDPWLGVRTIHDALDLSAINKSNTSWLNNATTYSSWYLDPILKRKPAIGYYDTSKVSTLEKHITQATKYGLSYFSFYWYWDSFVSREEHNDGLISFLNASNTNDMQFMLSVCQHGYYFSIKESHINAAATKIASYFNRPNYLKNSSGSPIVHICDVQGIVTDAQSHIPPRNLDWAPTAPINSFLNTLRSASFNATGKYPVLLGRLDSGTDGGGADIRTNLNNLVEGGTCVVAALPNSSSYTAIASSTKQTLNTIRTNKPFMPCVMHNLDDRPRMGIMKDPSPTIPFAVVSGYGLDNWTTNLKNAKYWMDAQTDEISTFLTVYAWNEWHEGGIIEPSEREGESALKAINDVFKLK
jgi:hypothetical protein